jgi:hypothetical protein
MIGGVVMVYAQIIRHRLLQHHEDQDLFGPDVLMNILIIAAVPFGYYLLGLQAMPALYLLSSVMALAFYKSYELDEGVKLNKSAVKLSRIKAMLAVMLLFPLFFQASTGLFRNPAILFDSGGKLASLPIPLSVLACYGGILILGAYKRATISLGFVFFSFILMVGTTIAGSEGHQFQQETKFLLLIQFILPMFGFVLGQLYETNENFRSANLAKAFLYTLAFIVPIQIFCSWMQGYSFLSPYLYLFSIYQHLHYVPIILVATFLVVFFSLWQFHEYKKILMVLAPLMTIYATMSGSVLAIAMLLAGMLGHAVYKWRNAFDKSIGVLFLIVVLSAWGYLQYGKDILPHNLPGSDEINQSIELSITDKVAPIINERIRNWKYYGQAIVSSPKTLLLGHVVPLERSQYTSAYNYYLDFIYNFGVLAILPMLALMAYTLAIIYSNFHKIYTSPGLLALSVTVIFLLLVENSFHVGLRQPYPGIFTYFLWGIMLNQISHSENAKEI